MTGKPNLIKDVLEHDGRTVTDAERQAALVQMPQVARAARDISARVSGSKDSLTRGELARALHEMARQVEEVNRAMLDGAVADDTAEVNVDDLRRHIVAVHAYPAGMKLDEAEAKDWHRNDHTSADGIRFHPLGSLYWDAAKFSEVMAEQEAIEAAGEGQ